MFSFRHTQTEPQFRSRKTKLRLHLHGWGPNFRGSCDLSENFSTTVSLRGYWLIGHFQLLLLLLHRCCTETVSERGASDLMFCFSHCAHYRGVYGAFPCAPSIGNSRSPHNRTRGSTIGRWSTTVGRLSHRSVVRPHGLPAALPAVCQTVSALLVPIDRTLISNAPGML